MAQRQEINEPDITEIEQPDVTEIEQSTEHPQGDDTRVRSGMHVDFPYMF